MLSGKEKRALRAQGNRTVAEVHVGKSGVTPGLLQNIDNALSTKELVKIKILRTCPLDKTTVANQISTHLKAEIVQILGRTLLVYRPLPEEE